MRRRILLLVVGMTTLVVLSFAIPLAVLTWSVVAQNADNATKSEARSIAETLRAGAVSDAELRTYVERQIADSGREISVMTPAGKVIGETPDDNRPATPTLPPNGGGGPGGVGPGEVDEAQARSANNGYVAVAFAPSPNGQRPYVVRVFLSNDDRHSGVTPWFVLLGACSVGLLLISALAGELLTRRITRPLIRTAETAQQLSVGDTSARAPTDGPREVADVGKALNRLADRIDELIAEERETVADLSHRLRTPLTTLRLEAEALTDPADAERLGTRVSELERMLTAVIRSARRPEREGRLPSSDASEVVRERVEFWSALTDEQGRSSTITLPSGPLPVRASAEDLGAAVDALLENVVAHTPEGIAFSVTLERTADGARLVIADEGAGIPEAAEIRGRSDRGSSGLGLDIARRCAEAAGGSMSVSIAASGGAVVTLLLHSP